MIDHWDKKKSNKELEIMLESGQKGKRFALICIILSYSTVHCRLFQWIIENLKNWENPENNRNYTLYLEAYFPYKWDYSPIFEITCCFQYMGIMSAAFSNSGTDAFFNQIIYHFVGQYQILRLKLVDLVTNINNNMSESEYNEEFKHIVYTHYHINRLFLLQSVFYHISTKVDAAYKVTFTILKVNLQHHATFDKPYYTSKVMLKNMQSLLLWK